MTRLPSGALVMGAIVSIQVGAALAATLFDRLGPGGVACLRLLFGAVILIAVVRPGLSGVDPRSFRLAALFGLVLTGMNLSFYEAIDRIPLGVAVSIEMVGPLAVATLGSRRRRELIWVLMAAVGILALTRGGGHPLNTEGVLLALLAGCLWGVYILVNARVGRAFPDSAGLAIAMTVGALAMLPVGIASAGGALFGPSSLALGLAVGILSSAVPYTLEVESLRRIAPHVFGVLMSIEPAVAALAGFVILGQSLGARTLAGIALVVAASVGASLGMSGPAPVAQ